MAQSLKKARLETDFKRCIQCQEEDKYGLVKEPSLETYSKFLNLVHEFGQYGYADYAEITCCNCICNKRRHHGTGIAMDTPATLCT